MEIDAISTKFWKIFLSAAIILIIGLLAFLYFSSRPSGTPVLQSPTPTISPSGSPFLQPISNYQTLPFDVLPPGIPQDIPLLGVKDFTKNATYKSSGIEYSVVQYRSSLDTKRLYEDYNKYLEKNNWKIQTYVDNQDAKTISASKTVGQVLSVLIVANQSGLVTVNITFIKPVLGSDSK